MRKIATTVSAIAIMAAVSACSSPGPIQADMTAVEKLREAERLDEMLFAKVKVPVPFSPEERGVEKGSLRFGAAKALLTAPEALEPMLGIEASMRAVDQTMASNGPRFDFEGKGGITDGSGNYERTKATYGAGATFGMTLFDFGRLEAQSDRDRFKLYGALHLVGERSEVIVDSVAQAHDDVLRLREVAKLAEASLGNVRLFRAAIVQEVKAGVAMASDVSDADAAIERAKGRLSDFRRLLADAEDRYERLTGLKAENLEIPKPVSQPATKELARELAKRHPTIEIAKANLGAAVMNAIAVDREAFGSVGVEAGPMGWSKALASGMDPWAIGAAVLKIAIPLLDGGERDARLARSVAAIQVALAQRAGAEQRINLATNLAWNAMEDAKRQAEYARAEAKNLDKALKAKKSEEFSAGLVRAYEILEAEDRALTARVKAVTATYAEIYSSQRLAAAQGRLTAEIGAADMVETSVDAKVNPWLGVAIGGGLFVPTKAEAR